MGHQCSLQSVLPTGTAAASGSTAQAELVERLFGGAIQALELYSVHLGRRLGLYRALADAGALSSAELASRAGIDERYAREWLEQQAVAGFLCVDDAKAKPSSRAYSLPEDHVAVFVDDSDSAHVAPLASMMVGVAGALPQVVEAYRSGDGVPFEAYGTDLREGQGTINKPAFSSDLTETWLPAVADLHERLSDRDRPARIADLGCGVGWSTIALTRAYPSATVIGYDLDDASIEDARHNAAGENVDARFERKHAAEIKDDGPFDLILILEALHDMAYPAEVLAACEKALAPGGSVFIADERVAERFEAPGDEVERMMYGWSVSHCLPASRCEVGSAAVGTAIRPSTVTDCANRAGLTRTEVLPIENDLFRFYRLRGEL